MCAYAFVCLETFLHCNVSVPESLFVPGPVLFQEKDFFLLSVCTGPKKMGYFSNLKNSPHSKGMEDIIARGYSNTGELSKLTWECKTYKRNDIDTATVSSTLCPLLHFLLGNLMPRMHLSSIYFCTWQRLTYKLLLSLTMLFL